MFVALGIPWPALMLGHIPPVLLPATQVHWPDPESNLHRSFQYPPAPTPPNNQSLWYVSTQQNASCLADGVFAADGTPICP
jgi:hypothetical protein